MKYLVFDFETTGIGKDKKNKYHPYEDNLMPLPRENFPVQIAAWLIDSDGTILQKMNKIISGAIRFDPFVLENCPHLSIKDCERNGESFENILNAMSDMATDATLVAHNIQYDWDEVLLPTAKEIGCDCTEAFLKLKNCPRFCTCVNEKNKRNKSAFFYRKLEKWIGPSLENLAKKYSIIYETDKAHDASYDVQITVQCLMKSHPEFFILKNFDDVDVPSVSTKSSESK